MDFGLDKKTVLCKTHGTVVIKNLEEKDGQRQLLYYVSLIRACNKVLYQLVYIGKSLDSLKRTLVFNEPVGPDNVKKNFVYHVISRFCNSL